MPTRKGSKSLINRGRQPTVLLLTVLAHQIAQRTSVARATSTCSICGIYGPPTIPLPDKRLPVAARPLDRCLDLEESSFFIEADTAVCEAMQAFGTYCGCNTPPDACTLCWDGSRAINRNLTIPGYTAADFVTINGFDSSITCETLEAFLHNTWSSDSDQCFDIQLDAGERCGCPPMPEDMVLSRNSTNSTTTNSTEADKEPQLSPRRCTICENGDPPPFPDRVVDIGREREATCAQWNTVASGFEDGSGDCALVRAAASGICECPRSEDYCTMCPLGEPIPHPERELNWLSRVFLSSGGDTGQSGRDNFLNCQLMESHVAGGYPLLAEIFGTEEELICTAMQMKSWICGCRPDWRQIVLLWCYRVSGTFSLIGSSLIIVSILRRPKSRFTAYHQLVLGISIFDMISSIAYMLVGVMAPYEAGFYLSRGNRTTCKIQGFMIQLGQTASMFYNLCLSLYFFMVIILRWREKFLRKILVGAHVCVIATGLGMSVGALPYIEAQFGVCGILPPLTASQWQISLFYTVPVSIVLIVLTTVTIVICYRVFSQQARVRRWRTDMRASVTKKVVWQSVWYVSAFYLTLPFVLLSFYVKFKSSRYFWIYIVTAILAPLQGTMNATIYFQRTKRFREFWSRLCRCRKTPKLHWSASGRQLTAGSSNNLGPDPFADSIDAAAVVDNVDAERGGRADVGHLSAGAKDKPEDCEDNMTSHVKPNALLHKEDDLASTEALSNSNKNTIPDDDSQASPDPMESKGDVGLPRFDVGVGMFQAATQPVSLFHPSKTDHQGEQTEREGGVLEYWKLHEEPSTL